MPSFADALNRSAEEIKRPPPLPIGHYTARVTKMPEPPETRDTKVGPLEFLKIPCATVGAGDDVDPDELQEFGNPAGVPFTIDFIFSPEDNNKYEAALNRLKNFCEHCGVDISKGSLQEWLSELPNAQFLVEMGQRMDPNDAEVFYAEAKRTAAL